MKKYYKNPNPYVGNPDFGSAEILIRSAQDDLSEARNEILGPANKSEIKRALRKAKLRIDQAMKLLR